MRKNAIMICLILILTVSMQFLALGWHSSFNASDNPKLIVCENHIDADLNMACDSCALILSQKYIFSNQKVETKSEDGLVMVVEGNMPSVSKVSTTKIEADEALMLAKKFNPNLEAKNIVFAQDISLNVDEDKYQPEEFGEEVSVDISNLDIDTNKLFAILHIKDDGSYETLKVNEISNNKIKFNTASFSTYILISVDSYNITFNGEDNFKVKSDAGIEFSENDALTDASDFRFIIEPSEGYIVTNVTVANEVGTNKTSLLEINGSSISKDCHLTNITENLIVNIETALAPKITTELVSTKVYSGETATFNIEVENVTGFEWQYKVSGDTYWQPANEIGQISTNNGTSQLTINNVTEDLNGYLVRCLLENDKCKEDNRVISNEGLIIIYEAGSFIDVNYENDNAMITKWSIPAGATITLPVSGTDLNVTIDWGDGSISGDVTEKFPTHTYTEGKDYLISISGTVPTWGYVGTTAPQEVGTNSEYYTYTKYLTGLNQWGDINASRYGFSMCTNLVYVSGDAADTTFDNVTNMSYMFNDCKELNYINVNGFDTPNVTNMSYMFKNVGYNVTELVLDLEGLNTSAVTSMVNMFEGIGYKATNLELKISEWDTSKVETTNNMFRDAGRESKSFAHGDVR